MTQEQPQPMPTPPDPRPAPPQAVRRLAMGLMVEVELSGLSTEDLLQEWIKQCFDACPVDGLRFSGGIYLEPGQKALARINSVSRDYTARITAHANGTYTLDNPPELVGE